jgi:hypothetical protein
MRKTGTGCEGRMGERLRNKGGERKGKEERT